MINDKKIKKEENFEKYSNKTWLKKYKKTESIPSKELYIQKEENNFFIHIHLIKKDYLLVNF